VKKIVLLFLLLASSSHAQEHPYITFENGFARLLKEKAWKQFKPDERKRLTRLLWRGSGRNLELASTMACQGIMESHYVLPSVYENFRGYHGTHNRTLIVEIRRHGLDGSEKMWLAYCKRDPVYVAYWSAARLRHLARIYKGTDEAVKCWVMGSDRTFKEDRAATIYLWNVKNLRTKYFGANHERDN
jgi:hypothetical protein